MELPEYTKINNHSINLLEDNQSPYGPMYSPEPVELEMLKTYIKGNLASIYIKPFKSLTRAPIPFIEKDRCNLYLCINYQGFTNLTLKN